MLDASEVGNTSKVGDISEVGDASNVGDISEVGDASVAFEFESPYKILTTSNLL